MGVVIAMYEDKTEIDHAQWRHVILVLQLIIAIIIFVTEVVNNTILYVTRSQGYGPDTIVAKLLRYLILTSVINFGSVFVSYLIAKKSHNIEFRKKALMLLTIIICTDVSFSHYQFSITFAVFSIPIMVSILAEDEKLCNMTAIASFLGMLVSVIARAMDPLYNKDIVPEGLIATVLFGCMVAFAKIIMNILKNRRTELGAALVYAEKAKSAEEQQKLTFKMLETLARAIDAKDRYTNGHSARVAVYSTILAKELGFDEEEIYALKCEALLHDIGKIGVPDSVLNKPTRLTDMEFKIIQTHSSIGANILKDMITLPGAADVARFHHERFDGNGYPSRLAGKDIPAHARVVGIADAYDAMSSDRIYRKALPENVIKSELVKGRGTQFDPDYLDVFLKLFEEGKLNNPAAETGSPFMVEDEDEGIRSAINDIETVLWHINQEDDKKDFQGIYKYMKNVGTRYNRTVEGISINLSSKEDEELTREEIINANSLLELSIHKNIRSVDIYFQNTDTQHIIIFLDAGKDNVDLIVQRIFFDFYNSGYTEKINLSYTSNEDLESIM